MSSNGRIIHESVVYTEYMLVYQNNRFRHAPLKLVLLLTAWPVGHENGSIKIKGDREYTHVNITLSFDSLPHYIYIGCWKSLTQFTVTKSFYLFDL